MDEALRRTRRNMIGVSVALILVYFLDWPFPKNLKLLNYEVPLTAFSIELIAWLFLAYLCIEYFIHLKSKFSEITTSRRNCLMQILAMYVWKHLDAEQRDEALASGKESFPDFNFDSLELTLVDLYKNDLRLSLRPNFINRSSETPSGSQGAGIKVIYKYSDIRWHRFRAWIRLVFTEGIGFEYIVPVFYPAVAIGLLLYRKIPFIVELA